MKWFYQGCMPSTHCEWGIIDIFPAGIARNLKHLKVLIAQHKRQLLIYFEHAIFQLLFKLYQACMHSLIVNEALVAFSLADMARNLKHLNLSIAQHQRQILIILRVGFSNYFLNWCKFLYNEMILSSLHPLAVISLSANEAKLAFFLTGMARSLKKLNWLTTQLYRDILIYIESTIFKLLSKLKQILCIMKWSYQGSIHVVWMRHYWHFIYGINLKYLNLVKAWLTSMANINLFRECDIKITF